MAQLLAAMLCVILIATFPKLLTIVFDHAEEVKEQYLVDGVYDFLGALSLIYVGLMVFFMWLGHNAKPSGFDELLLRALGKSIGRDGEGSPAETNNDISRTTSSEVPGESTGEEQQKAPSSDPGKPDHAV